MQSAGGGTYESDNSAAGNEQVSEARPNWWVKVAYPKKTFSTVMDVSRKATWPRASNAKVVKKPAAANTHGQSSPRPTKAAAGDGPATCALTKVDNQDETQEPDDLFALISRQLVATTAGRQAESHHFFETRQLRQLAAESFATDITLLTKVP